MRKKIYGRPIATPLNPEKLVSDISQRIYDALEGLLPQKKEVLLAAEKTVIGYSGAGGFPNLTFDMVHNGMPVVLYWDGVKYETEVIVEESSVDYAYAHFEDNNGETVTYLFIYSYGTTLGYTGEESHVASVYTYEDVSIKDGFSPTVTPEFRDDGVLVRITDAEGEKTFFIQHGDKGDKGDTGSKGADGKTPVKGVDYWTTADQEAIVQQVIAALGTPVFGRVDADNNIILTGALADGTYTLKYEDENGEVVEIGTIDIGGASYTNQLPISTDASGAVYNGTGYKTGHRLGSSSTESAVDGTNPTFITGFIPIANGQTVRLKNCYIDTDGINGFNSAETVAYYGKAANSLYISLYNSSKGAMNAVYWSNLSGSGYFTNLNTDSEGKVTEFKINRSDIAYIRLTLAGDAPNAIITVDQPITD